MGAKLIGDFGRSGAVSRSEARRMLTFCSTSGPLFMLGAVGTGMLVSPAAGAVIALAHYFGALLNGLMYRIFLPRKQEPQTRSTSGTTVARGSMLEIFTDSMITSFRSLGIICGYIVLFMMITDFIQYSGILEPLRTEYGRSFIKGCLEMTVGCSGIANSGEPDLLLKCVLCSFLISFGGLSIYAQSMSMLSGLNIGSVYYFMTKISHGLLAGVIAWLIGPHLLKMEALETWALQRDDLMRDLGFFYQLLFSTKMVIMVVFLFLITIMLDKFIRRIHERFRNHSGV
jgi:sporulation integral membrane protein YlbJ